MMFCLIINAVFFWNICIQEEEKDQDDKVVVSVSCCPKNNVVCVMTEK